MALPARSDSDELEKENNKSVAALKGQAVFSIAKVGRLIPSYHNRRSCTWTAWHDSVAADSCLHGWRYHKLRGGVGLGFR